MKTETPSKKRLQPPTYEFSAPLHHETHPSLQWIEVSSTLQLPGFQIVGLPGKEVNEARERVRAAIEASGFEFPRRRVILNLSPANIRKQGTGIDLAMALSILVDPGEASSPSSEKSLTHFRGTAWGELGLDGRIKPCAQLTRTLLAACEQKVDFVVLGPEDPQHLSAAVRLLTSQSPSLNLPRIGSFRYLTDALNWITELNWQSTSTNDINLLEFSPSESTTVSNSDRLLPLSPQLSRILGIAAAGKHHLILLGARGTGKSHAIEWLENLQLPVAPKTRMQQQCLAEIAHVGPHASPSLRAHPSLQVPIRRVGQQIRPAALIGRADSNGVHPGEFTLAQGGLLIADEFLEWNRDSREALREPLERGTITLTRAWAQVELPARFTLAATGNLCRCGGWPPTLHRQLKLEYAERGVRLPECVCLPRDRVDYISKLSGPLFDRIDLVFRTPPLLPEKNSESSRKNATRQAEEQALRLREKILKTHQRMIHLWGVPTSELRGSLLEDIIETHPVLFQKSALQEAASLRSRHRTLRVAMALALWDTPTGDGIPQTQHLREALSYRGEALGLGGG